ncbi:MAG: hypothetical protein WC505_08020 [Patescibacteria group bacterium]
MSKKKATRNNMVWPLTHTIAGLRYIASSPPQEGGGFHANAIMTAKSALHHIARLRKNQKGPRGSEGT